MEQNIYTVKRLAELAGITPRTLHHYDEIGLLKPSSIGANGYRHYNEQSLFRLQQILFYRELDLDLMQIKKILNDKKFDLVSALQKHRQSLQERTDRLQTLIKTVDTTIMHLIGEVNMSKKNIFEGFSEEKQKEYEKQAIAQWGASVKESTKLWNSYSEDDKLRIQQEGGAVYQDLVAKMDAGPESAQVKTILVRWHEHLRYFYEPSLDILRGLGNAYNEHPDFHATFEAIHPDLPVFLQKAINHYVDVLETKWLERELGILEE